MSFLSFEMETVPLFIGGVVLVSVVELVVGCILLRAKKRAIVFFISSVLASILGFCFLIYCLFGDRFDLKAGIISISNSVSIGLFGLLWFVSVMLLLFTIREAVRRPPL